MRRENEKLLQKDIETNMEEAKDHIAKADVIFLHAPGFDKTLFLSKQKSLKKYAHKVRAIEYESSKANASEANYLVKKILEAKVKFSDK